jgi:hypothetical protein
MNDIKKPYDKWQETTLRKGTKSPKICKDMFIADSRGEFTFCEVKNGQIVARKKIDKSDAFNYIFNENLIGIPDMVFANCKTYRSERSHKLIADINK